MLVHATTVDLSGAGVIISGASGSGKSRTALQLLTRGALLVSDDQTALRLRDDRLLAACPDRIKGLIEVRGIGVLRCATIAETRIRLAVELSLVEPERMPEGCRWNPFRSDKAAVRLLRLNSQDACLCEKILVALGNADDFHA